MGKKSAITKLSSRAMRIAHLLSDWLIRRLYRVSPLRGMRRTDAAPAEVMAAGLVRSSTPSLRASAAKARPVQTSAPSSKATAAPSSAEGKKPAPAPSAPVSASAGTAAHHKHADVVRAAAMEERKRCKRIVQYGMDNGCSIQAAVFAFDTSLSVSQAISVLSAAANDRHRRSPLQERMEMYQTTSRQASAQVPHSASGPEDLATQILAAGHKARGEEVPPTDTVGALMRAAKPDPGPRATATALGESGHGGDQSQQANVN